ncbi:MAG: D-alanyl-D-alanine carboxypeptidase/D-alanyl-D-alanine-endopeptidase [Deltaproteobacteria bacterium]|nr:D-alanyl-D-alanine carboxypeptidase/D-alanyl-D-alanine-endopeptidase [Deltaproteobacteria bacterium]
MSTRLLRFALPFCVIVAAAAAHSAPSPLVRITVDVVDAGPADAGQTSAQDGGVGGVDGAVAGDGGAAPAEGWGVKIAELLRHPSLKGALTSLHAVNIKTGATVCASAPDLLVNPASVTKVVTAAAALEYLGPHYQFETRIYLDAFPEDGAAEGNVYFKGFGDPQLTSERVFLMVGEIMQQGLKKVSGDLVIDDTWFDDEREPRGWDRVRGEGAYYAGTGAFSVNFNSVTVNVKGGPEGKPALVTIEPPIPFVKLVNKTTTSAKGRREISVKIKPAKGGEEVTVSGKIASDDEKTYYRRVSNPPLYAAHLVRETMKMRGFKIGGKIKIGKVPGEAELFHVYHSLRLAAIARDMNKSSNNFTAEQVLKVIGGGGDQPASFDKGLVVMEQFLEKTGVKKGTYTMTNGSGLSHQNRFSSAQIVKVLQYVYGQWRYMPDFVSSMSIAAGDGTVRKRYRGSPAAYLLRAKTGSIDGVASLCGYVPNAAGDLLAFSVITNGFPPKKYREITHIQDDIASALAESR